MITRTHEKMLGVVVHIGNPSAGETEIGRKNSRAGQPSLLSEFQDSKRPCLKQKVKST